MGYPFPLDIIVTAIACGSCAVVSLRWALRTLRTEHKRLGDGSDGSGRP